MTVIDLFTLRYSIRVTRDTIAFRAVCPALEGLTNCSASTKTSPEDAAEGMKNFLPEVIRQINEDGYQLPKQEAEPKILIDPEIDRSPFKEPTLCYSIKIHKAISEDGFFATCEAMPDCGAGGDTIEETIQVMKEAMETMVYYMTKIGASLPPIEEDPKIDIFDDPENPSPASLENERAIQRFAAFEEDEA